MANGVFNFISNMASYPFHMPGHKRSKAFADLYSLGAWADITEISGADDLHNPTGILRALSESVAQRWGADKSYVLANGSTCGNLAAMGTLGKRGDTVLVARNCHRSVYHGLELFGYRPVFITPDYLSSLGVYGSVSPKSVEEALRLYPNAAFLVITSPTYEGIISDIKAIVDLCHSFGVALLVDEAHGAHLDLSPCFTGSAVVAGADVSVQSLHKTLPALTPAALLHLKGDRVDRQRLAHYLRLFQSSSPSYPLMASVELCTQYVAEPLLFKRWMGHIDKLKQLSKDLKDIKISALSDERGIYARDPSKLLITGKNGIELASILRKQGIETEHATNSFVLAMTGAGDSEKGFFALSDALIQADSQLCGASFNIPEACYCDGEMKMPIEAAINAQSALTDLKDCAGKIAAEYLWAYPPGIPLLVPGQQITASFAACCSDGLVSDSGALPLVAVIK